MDSEVTVAHGNIPARGMLAYLGALTVAALGVACGPGDQHGVDRASISSAQAGAPMVAMTPAGPPVATPPSTPVVPQVPVDPGKLDPDDDGLSTAFEQANGTDPNKADTDGDGVGDLAERVAMTRPNDPKDSPKLRGNFYFLSPFEEMPTPEREPLLFSTALRSADLMVLVDTTASMESAIVQLQEKLSNTIVPQASSLIPDLQIGVASFEDVSVGPYGGDDDSVFELQQALTADPMAAQAGVNALALGGGGDSPEAAIPALHALATGQGFDPFLPDAPACAQGAVGYACFRADAVPIVLLVTDAEFHNGPDDENAYTDLMQPAPTYQQAVDALRAIKARVISIGVGPYIDEDTSFTLPVGRPIGGGIWGGRPAMPAMPAPMTLTAREQMERLSADTGAADATGKPLFFAVDENSAGLDGRVVDAVRAVAQQVPISVSAVVRDDPSDSVDATQLILRVEPNVAGGVADPMDPTRVCQGGLKTEDRNMDGAADTFVEVLPGVPLCFDVVARENTTVPAAEMPMVYKAFIDVLGDGKTVLSTREVFFLVPPSSPVLL